MAQSPNRCFLCVFLVFLCINSLRCATARRNASGHFIDFEVNSLLPHKDLSCKHSTRGNKQGVSLEVMHRHGPCSKLKSGSSTKHGSPSHSELLLLDQDRVESIHARVSSKIVIGGGQVHSSSASLPARPTTSIGAGNYIVTVGLGTPQKDLSLVFDTGSDVTWTQCKPCKRNCHKNSQDPIFDPTSSSSYSNVSCDSTECSNLGSASAAISANKLTCTTCKYRIRYSDKSTSQGFLAKDRLTLNSNDYINDFVFGCGQSRKGFFSNSAGMLALGQNPLSLVWQMADKYGKYFSYCLPRLGSTGHLTLGQGGIASTSMSYTSLLKGSEPSFYYVDLQSISVNGRRLAISTDVFSTAGTIMDSGTVISRLPMPAYTALRDAFKEYMSAKYPKAPRFTFLDTCYDLSNYTTAQVPKVTLYFGGGGVMDLPETGIITFTKGLPSQACLAFAGNNVDTDPGIVGNVQQQGFDVVYDVDGGRIGLGSNGC